MAKKITASITISRDSSDAINISIVDELSRQRFVRVTMTPHEFAMAVTGLSSIEAQAEVVGLEYVGLRKIIEKRSAICPLSFCDKRELADWLLANCQEEGWTINTYLGSQGSIGHNIEGGRQLNYSVFRYTSDESGEV